jgi:hypothetical protein
MSSSKNRPKCSPTHFLSNSIHKFFRGKREPKSSGYFYRLKKLPKVDSPNRRNFAQSATLYPRQPKTILLLFGKLLHNCHMLKFPSAPLVEVGRAWARARRSGSGLGFLLNKTQSLSAKGLKIGQSPTGPKIEPFRPDSGPKGLKKIFVDLCSKIL